MSGNLLINITAVVLAIFVASFLWMGLSPLPPAFIYFTFGSVGVLLTLLFVLNIGFALFRPKQRIAHIIIILMIIVMTVGFMPLCATLIGDRQRQWFFQSGRQMYEPMVAKIIQNKGMLTSANSSLKDIVNRSDVFGKTNADGSINVFFIRGNNGRHCWLYYSGSKMIAIPSNTSAFSCPDMYGHTYFHLTNGWYESIP